MGKAYHYCNDYSTACPGLCIVLVDQSRYGAERTNDCGPFAREIALSVNNYLLQMVIGCAMAEGFRECLDIAVLGYRTDEAGSPIVEPALIGPLAGRKVVSISELDSNLARKDTVTSLILDDDTEDLIEVETEVPIWIDPIATGEAPICHALAEACLVVDEAVGKSPDQFPPIVFNFSYGVFSDGDPWLYADAIKQRGTRDGKVLLVNTYVSPGLSGDPVVFPSKRTRMPDRAAETLFACSSLLPDELQLRFKHIGIDLPTGAKCMAINADPISMLNVLPFGGRNWGALR